MPPASVDSAGLSRRELEVFLALRDRPTNAELAGRLYISERTVESHISALLRKLDVTSRLDLARLATEHVDAAASRSALPPALELLADQRSFFGREAELERLVDAWEQACSGRVLVRVVTGEAGIGKSRLAAELGAEVRRRGGVVLFGACTEDSPVPFEPFRRALADTSPARSHAAEALAAAAVTHDRLWPADGAATTGQVEGVAGALGALAFQQAHLLVIEDLHWGTPVTRAVVTELARGSVRSKLLVVATARDTPPDLDGGLAAFLGGLERLPSVVRTPLGGLDGPAVAALLDWLGEAGDADARRAETGGNPLFLNALASLDRPTGTLQALLAERDRLVPGEDLEVLDVAAVIGVEIPVDLLAEAAGVTVPRAIAALEKGAAAGIVAALPGRPGSYTFVHGLFRTVRYHRLAAGTRLRLHAAVASALERRHGDPDDRARHACLAGPLHDRGAAARLALEAGDRIGILTDPEAAARRYVLGLGVVDGADPPAAALRLRLTVRHGHCLALQGDPRARDVLAGAVRDARAIGDVDAMAEAALAMSPVPGGAASPGRPDREFVQIAEEVLALLPEPAAALRVRLLAALGVQLRLAAEPERGMALADEAVERARMLGDDVVLGHALLAWRYGGTAPQRVDETGALGVELAMIGRRTGHAVFTHAGLSMTAAAQRQRGELTAAARTLSRLPRVETPWVRFTDEARSISDEVVSGRLAAARGRLDDFGARVRAHGEASSLLHGTLDLILRHYECRLVPPRVGARGDTSFVFVDAMAAVALGQAAEPNEAVEILERYLLTGSGRAWRSDYSSLLALAAFADAASIVGHAPGAVALLAMLDRHAGQLAAVNTFALGSVDYHRADLRVLTGRMDEAVAIAEGAVAASRARGTPLFLGRELALLADARSHLTPGWDGAGALRAEAEAIAAATGCRLIALDLERRHHHRR